MARGSGVVLRDVLDIKEDVLAGDFKVALSEGFTDARAGSIDDYVVTEQLQGEFRTALKLVGSSLRKNASQAAYLHGSFGAGKSHFLTVLHAVLNGDPAVEDKARLREVIAENADWLPGRRFLMVPYHLVGAASLESALLGGYVRTVRRERPDAPTPLVFRADSLLADARELREQIGDEAFIKLLPAPVAAPPTAVADDGEDDDEELKPIGAIPAVGWTSEALDAAFHAPAGDPGRDQLLTALFNGPNKHYAETVSGDAGAYISLDDGLSEISKHARLLGYDGVVLFLDELVLWLQARMSDRTFINNEVQKLVKLIESSNPDRPVPIISFISRQRDLSQLMGSDILGSDVENLQAALEYLKERVTVIDLEDRNLPEIIKERVLKPLPGQERVLDTAFAGIDRAGQTVKDVLLDGEGATGAGWDDFRAVYPLSPALLNVLVALSGALQRERTGLKLVQQLLERNADAEVGRLVPLGDLWDVLVDPTSTAFTAKLQQESDTARRFHLKARRFLLRRYGHAEHPDFVADERFVKTLLLAALAPDVPALRRLTAGRLAALNHGTLRSRAVPVQDKVVQRMRALQDEFPSELRSEGKDDPVYSLHLSELDIDPILDAVVGEDKGGVRRTWLRERLWEELGLAGRQGQFFDEKKIVWRGSERTVEFVFGLVRDPRSVADESFEPGTAGNVRIILDCPYDEEAGHSPDDALRRVTELRRSHPGAPVLVWLCDHFSEQRKAQLGQLMRINFLLERDRLSDYTRNFPPDDRAKARRQLEHARENLTRTLVESLREVYGLAEAKEGTRGAEVPDEGLLASAALLLQWSRHWVEPVTPPPEPRHLIAQQLLALCLQEHRVGDNLWQEWWGGIGLFGPGAAPVVRHLVERGYLDQDAGMLFIGPEAEQRYGHRHFMNLTAVFTAPPEFTVLNGRHEIGRTDPDLLTEEVQGPRRLLLAGRSWQVTHVDFSRRRCFVTPADEGGRARWAGFGPERILSFDLARAARDVLLGEDPPVRLTGRAAARLAEAREAHLDTVHPGGTVIARRPDGDVRWWTWAGHRANATLAATLLPAVSPHRRAHAHWVRLRDDLSREDWATAMAQASEGLSLPEIDGRAVRGLKFAEALPARLAEATLAARTVDEAGARAALGEPVRFTNLQSES